MTIDLFKVDFEVRDSELDTQGIVNNANYFVYLEHARHKWLKEKLKIDFVDWSNRGFHFVLLESHMQFKKSLKSGDRFYAVIEVAGISRLKVSIKQTVYLSATDELVLISMMDLTCINQNAVSPRERYFIPDCF